MNALNDDLPTPFHRHFEAAESGHWRMNPAGVQELLPRLERHGLALPTPATAAEVRTVMRRLQDAELTAGLAEIDTHLTRADISQVERDLLESLLSLHTSARRPLLQTIQASEQPAAEVVDLAAWRASRQR